MSIDGEHEATIDDEIEIETPEGEIAEGEAPENQGGEDEFDIEIEGEGADDETPPIRQMREELRRTKRELQEARASSAPKPIDLGPEPTWGDGDEWDYDGDKFAKAQLAYAERKRQHDEQTRQQQEAANRNREEWLNAQRRMTDVAASKRIPNFTKMHDEVTPNLPPALNEIITRFYGDEAPVAIAALHKYPKLMDRTLETAKTDIGKAAFDLHRDIVKANLNMAQKRPRPEPESASRVRGTVSVAGAAPDKTEAALLKKARQTGDRTELNRYRATKK